MNQDEFEHKLDDLLRQIIAERESMRDSSERARELIVQSKRMGVERQYDELDQAFNELIRSVYRDAEGRVVEQLAVTADAGWDSEVWLTHEPPERDDCPPPLLRFGELSGGGRDAPTYRLPAMLPFFGSGHLVVLTDDAGVQEAFGCLNSILFRALMVTPPGRTKAVLLDTREAGRAFAQVRSLVPSACHQPVKLWDASEIHLLLGELLTHVETINRDVLVGRAGDVLTHNRSGAKPPVGYRILALSGFPGGLDEEGMRLLSLLASNGPAAGVQMVVVADIGAVEEVNEIFGRQSLVVRRTEGGFRVMQEQLILAGLSLDQLPEPPTAWMKRAAAKIEERIEFGR